MLFVGALLLTGVYAYRKQRLAEGDATRADAQQFADRYTKAAEQLGAQQAAVRLAGVYAMTRLADDWEDQRQTCIDVLCAYLRMPYHPTEPTQSTDAAVEVPDHLRGEDQVRDTVIHVLADHLRAQGPTSWSTADIDLHGAHLDQVDFTGARFSGYSGFDHARFSGDAWFGDATFSGPARFGGATFSGDVRFGGATFSGDAGFGGTTFSGDVRFDGATAMPRTRRADIAAALTRATFEREPQRGPFSLDGDPSH